jgi:ribosomal-protein-alanine N-acetyltransferase
MPIKPLHSKYVKIVLYDKNMPVQANNSYHIRRMVDGDIPQALDIDLDAFPSQWPHPTTSSFHHEMRNKLAHYIVLCKNTVRTCQSNGRHPTVWHKMISCVRRIWPGIPGQNVNHKGEYLAGMAGLWMMVDEAHIVTIAVRNAHKNQGLGEWLLINIIDLATRLQARWITLEVRVSNQAAKALYEKYGFSIAGTRRKYYSDNGEDAYIMTTDELNSPRFQELFLRMKDEHRIRWSSCYSSN